MLKAIYIIEGLYVVSYINLKTSVLIMAVYEKISIALKVSKANATKAKAILTKSVDAGLI